MIFKLFRIFSSNLFSFENFFGGFKKGAKGIAKTICANVDLYSGLVYRTLGIPEDLYTPMFACARVAGWCAHRLEEIATGGKIMRPAYKSLSKVTAYVELDER